jgi:uncharacterized protein
MLAPMRLSAECARVLGSLVEKALTTPQQYPLTINALVGACNQTSNREPVVSYDETTVLSALDQLKDQRLVRFVLPSHGRSVVRYRQVVEETLGLDARQCAILSVLLLRGPQTVGELRIRTERMTQFDRLDEIEHELDLLASRDEPLAVNVGRRPGQKEERWASSLHDPDAVRSGNVAAPDATTDTDADVAASPPGAGSGNRPLGERVHDVEVELTGLRADVSRLRQELEDLRTGLGG